MTVQILEQPKPERWSCNWMCHGCGATLACKADDIEGITAYYVRCPICNTQLDFSPGGIVSGPGHHSLPMYVKRYVDERRREA